MMLSLVEVRGVEPRSAEFFVSKFSERSHRLVVGRWDHGSCLPSAHPEWGLARRSRNPAGGIPLQRRPYPTGREPTRQDGLPIYQAASAICGLALVLFARLFCEVPETSARFRHGDYSTSNPSHPHVFSVPPNYIDPLRHPSPRFLALAETRNP